MQDNFQMQDYHFARIGEELPAVSDKYFYDYVVAGNGIFMRAKRAGLEVCIPCGFADIRGLDDVTPYIQWGYPKVNSQLVGEIFKSSRWACENAINEKLFYLKFKPSSDMCGWSVDIPAQKAGSDFVHPIQTGAGSQNANALIELHSHPDSSAHFSPKDDEDEKSGFRIYAVIGRIFHRPEIRVRVGCYGYFMEIPASEIFELPEGVTDCFIEENKL